MSPATNASRPQESPPTTSRIIRDGVIEIDGRYEFSDVVIDRGATSTVYLGRQITAGNRAVAIKVFEIPSDPLERENRHKRMMAERHALGAIKDPGIVSIIDSGTIADGPLTGRDYVVMEYVGAGSLQDRINEIISEGGIFPPREVARILTEVGKSVAVLEKHGIVHRDIKPGNILFDSDGKIKLADFGLARIEGLTPGLTAQGIAIGTRHYMSPEQARGERCDVRSDLWALGAVALHLATGAPPIGRYDIAPVAQGEIPKPESRLVEIVRAKADRQTPIDRVEDCVPGFPAALGAVIDRLLEKDPASRYQNAEEFLDALALATAALESQVEPNPAEKPQSPECAAATLELKKLPDEPLDSATQRVRRLSGIKIGTIKVGKLIDTGATGAVFEAFDEQLKRPVAIKFLKPLTFDTQESKKRFEREAQNAARLHHQNVVAVYSAGIYEDVPWIALEFVDGHTLRWLIERIPSSFELRLALTIIRQALEGCHAAHEIGLVHRDIKPANIMVIGTEEEVIDPRRIRIKVTDMGLLRSPDRREAITEDGVFYGTPEYASPEQARGEEVDPRTDQYSLGVCLYEMLAGGRPYTAPNPTPLAWLMMIGDEKVSPVPLSVQNPRLPQDVVDLVHRMIAKKRDARFPTALEAIRAIDEILAKLDRGQLAARHPRRRVAVVTAAVFVVIALVVGFLIWRPSGKKPTPRTNTNGLEIARTNPGPNVTKKTDDTSGTKEENREKKEPAKVGDDKREAKTEKWEDPPKKRPLTEVLAEYSPTPQDLAFIRALLALAGASRGNFVERDYTQFAPALSSIEKDFPSVSEPEKSFRARILNGAREMVDLASSIVAGRLQELVTLDRQVTVKLKDKREISGRVREARVKDGEVTLLASEGGLVTVKLAELAPEDFLATEGLERARIAFAALTVSPTDALERVLALLPSTDDLASWVPILVRLAREEGAASARAGEVAPAHEIFKRLAESQNHGPEATRISRLFPYLGEIEFAVVEKEKTALALLQGGRLVDVAVGYADTSAFPCAARSLLERDLANRYVRDAEFLRKLLVVDRATDQILENERSQPRQKFLDLVGGIHSAWWTIQPKAENPQAHFDVEPRSEENGTVFPAYLILRDKNGLQRLHRQEGKPVPAAERGLVLCYRFVPSSKDSHWRFALIGADKSSLYLRLTDTTAELFRPSFEGGADRLLASARSFDAPKNPQAWRMLTFLPVSSGDAGVLLVYVDLDPLPILRVSLNEASLSPLPVFTVAEGELHIRNLFASLVDKAGEDK